MSLRPSDPPGGGLVESGGSDVRASDGGVPLHGGRRRELARGHRQVSPSPDRLAGFFCRRLQLCVSAHVRRILKRDPPFPKDMDPSAKDLIQRLLTKDPKKRLGSGPNGAENIKQHPFYQVSQRKLLEERQEKEPGRRRIRRSHSGGLEEQQVLLMRRT